MTTFNHNASRFADFHRANPHIFWLLLARTREAKASGRDRIGLKMLVEVARWDHMVKTTGDPFKLANAHTAFYARTIMALDPTLNGIFSLGRQSLDWTPDLHALNLYPSRAKPGPPPAIPLPPPPPLP